MKLTEKDKAYLKECGAHDEDFTQIEEVTAYTKYTLYEKNPRSGDYDIFVKKLNQNEVIELLGRNMFISGLNRSAFHFDAVRLTSDGEHMVFFDSSKFFKNS